ncbi:MAG: rfaE bifunctional protein nucleotidyltransferase chain/domain [Kiritimatiellia bacterium]|jgi:rfaE bifunctional protein nucleotidyltransferase chain/domain
MREAAAKILSREALAAECERLRANGTRVAFTNGTFDILHAGHVTYLAFARKQGDVLIVGLNSDASIRRIKGEKRPIINEPYRSAMLAALECVDYVCLFDEDEPCELLKACLPDVLIKGEDWAHNVIGREIVEERGGEVVLAPMVEGLSTSAIIARILDVHRDE